MIPATTITIRRGPVCLIIDVPHALPRETFSLIMEANAAVRSLSEALERDAQQNHPLPPDALHASDFARGSDAGD